MNKFINEIKFLVITFLIAIFSVMYVAFVITIGWIISFFVRKKVNDMGERLKFMWLIIFNHYKKMFSDVGLNVPNFKIKRPKLSLPDIDISVDTEDVALMLVLLWEGLHILWLFYAIVNTILMFFVYTAVFYNPVAVNVDVKKEIPKQVFIPTDADKQEIELCPCTISYKMNKDLLNDKNFRNIALLESGTGELKYSNSYIVVFEDNSFKKRDSQNITALEMMKSGTYKIEWLGDVVFEINPYQAFQVLDDPFFTYMLDNIGELYLIQTEKLKLQKKD